MPFVYVPDAAAPQAPYQHYPPFMPAPPQQPLTKKAKKISLKQMYKAKTEIEEMMRAVEESAKKNKKEDKKKRDGLNWIELSLLLIFISLPIAVVELIGALSLVKASGLIKLING